MTSPQNELTLLFRHASFVNFWIARLFTISGYQMLCVAIGWHLYDITGSALDLGLIGLVQFLPRVLFVLQAGHVADHHDRRRVAALSQLLQAACALGLAASLAYPEFARPMIYLVSFMVGVGRTFEFPATQAMLPRIVTGALLPPAVAISATAVQAATIASPAIGGLLYALGAGVVYVLTGGLYLMACLLMLRVKFEPSNAAPPPQQPGLEGLLAGVRFIKSRPAVLGAISLDLFAVLLGGATALLPVYAKDILHAGPWALGVLRAAPAVGALAMGAWLARYPIRKRVGKVMFVSVALFGVATIAFGVSTSIPLSFAALTVLGAADMVSVVIRNSFIQLETPDEMRGRVSAVNSVFIGASNQLGEFESGVVAALLGPVLSVVTGGIGTLLVVALWMKWFPQLSQQDRMPGT
ncbi:Predicted arabinose efflux permease, MFS family [Formivibrio citricus]|uniref:Predicted arabinose efflux permease, MFS family n=1 Tax=Formivibrio citricus TaxID=83765 RepID=A0A1I4XEA8_9NEIS|nr:MFS transporter [Formivibrio citricus]SFN24105.1 Predicted arabinose efflux permease, MFS family [Formivibrio citricus]